MSEAINIFRFIKDYSAKNQGCIDGKVIDAIMEKYLQGMYKNIDRYYENNMRCYASVNASNVLFNNRKLTHFLVTEYMKAAIEKTFVGQTKDSSKNWTAFFVHALMTYASHKLEMDLSADVGRRYNVLAFVLLEGLTVEACVQDPEMRAILKSFVERFSPALKNEKILEDLTFYVNREIDERFSTFGPNRMHVTNMEMKALFMRLMA
ncbi:MAG: hypothetical protein C0606_06625 [Hyphomicrobiales bacterium]|nr:MAG: hypothetical protein C0606_06625 [Hyphomicrobiales bacterium]